MLEFSLKFEGFSEVASGFDHLVLAVLAGDVLLDLKAGTVPVKLFPPWRCSPALR